MHERHRVGAAAHGDQHRPRIAVEQPVAGNIGGNMSAELTFSHRMQNYKMLRQRPKFVPINAQKKN